MSDISRMGMGDFMRKVSFPHSPFLHFSFLRVLRGSVVKKMLEVRYLPYPHTPIPPYLLLSV